MESAASLQYAIEVVGVKDIIVCGHSHCGAIKGLFQDLDDNKLGLVKKWLQIGDQVKKATLECMKVHHLPPEEMYQLAEKISVIYQLDHLMSFPFVRKRVLDKTLFLHGWYFDIQKVRFPIKSQNSQFISLIPK